MSARPEANTVRTLELVNLDSATKAARLYDNAGHSFLIGITGEKGSGTMFVSHNSHVYVGSLYWNPGLYKASGECLYERTPGFPLHEAIEFLVGIRNYSPYDTTPLLPKLAYFKDFNAHPNSLRFRLVVRVQDFSESMQERFLEADVVFHKLPGVLTGRVNEDIVE